MADDDAGNIAQTPASVGAHLKQAREAAGLSRTDIAARTKIAERHIAAIEDNRFGDLASSTYAVGFSRAYARSVGLDEHQIANSVRKTINTSQSAGRPTLPTFEPGDPARIPGSLFAWVAAGAAIVVVLLVLNLWRSYYSPAASLPDLTEEPVAAASTAAPVGVPAPAPLQPLAQGPVTFTATQNRVWVKFTDAAGNQLMQKEMTLGESYTLPPEANGPRLRTIRADALRITVGGRPIPPLGDAGVLIRDMPVSAAALIARGQPAPPAPTATAAPVASVPAHRSAPSPRPATPQREVRPATSPRVAPSAAPPADPPQPPVAAEAAAAGGETSTVTQ